MLLKTKFEIIKRRLKDSAALFSNRERRQILTSPTHVIIGIFSTCLAGPTHRYHRCHDHLEFWSLSLLFNIAVNNHNGAISLVIQSIIIYGGRWQPPMSPLYMTCPTFIGIRVFWNKDDRFLQHKGDETLRPMIDQFVVDEFFILLRVLTFISRKRSN
jgi:hypothetical protein